MAATVEVLTTIVTTTALQKLSLPQAAVDTVGAASREELEHYIVLTQQFGGHAATHRVWVPDAVFADPTSLFTTLVVGEQICIDLYLVATSIWAAHGHVGLARAGAELVGNEAVHRALARQALGLQPNDRAFMKYDQRDQADGPGHGTSGFTNPAGAIHSFEAAGIGFGARGASPGAFYEFGTVRQHTPTYIRQHSETALIRTRLPRRRQRHAPGPVGFSAERRRSVIKCRQRSGLRGFRVVWVAPTPEGDRARLGRLAYATTGCPRCSAQHGTVRVD
ncbi:MAG: hypothetical protein WBP81_08020 [Solirubrobacteraceae bacterium]